MLGFDFPNGSADLPKDETLMGDFVQGGDI
jgi:hypothetical protein